MKRKASFMILLILISSLATILSVPLPVFAQTTQPRYLTLTLDKKYGFKGDFISIETGSDWDYVTVCIYDPNGDLIYTRLYNGNQTRFIPIQNNAIYGYYRIEANISDLVLRQYFTVASLEGFSPASFPFVRTHQGIEYSIFANKTFKMTDGVETAGFNLPDLPSGVMVNAYNNSDMFVARFKSGVIDIDLSFIFIQQGVKLRINGTSDAQKDFKFKFFSPKQIRRFGTLISFDDKLGFDPLSLQFDYYDLKKAGNYVSWDGEYLVVHDVPKSFDLDPFFGKNTTGEGWETCEDKITGSAYLLLENSAGTLVGKNITAHITFAAKFQAALYNNDTGVLVAYTEEKDIVPANEWVTFDFIADPTLTNNTYYKIVMWCDALAYIHMGWTGGEFYGNDTVYATASFPNPATFDRDDDNRDISIYCTYEVGAAGNSYTRSVSQAVSTTWSVWTSLNELIKRTVSQTVTFTWSVWRNLADFITRGVSQGLTFTWDAYRYLTAVVLHSRAVSVSLTFTWDAYRNVGVFYSRAVSQGINWVSNAYSYLTAAIGFRVNVRMIRANGTGISGVIVVIRNTTATQLSEATNSTGHVFGVIDGGAVTFTGSKTGYAVYNHSYNIGANIYWVIRLSLLEEMMSQTVIVDMMTWVLAFIALIFMLIMMFVENLPVAIVSGGIGFVFWFGAATYFMYVYSTGLISLGGIFALMGTICGILVAVAVFRILSDPKKGSLFEE